jgi:hypothetical protein
VLLSSANLHLDENGSLYDVGAGASRCKQGVVLEGRKRARERGDAQNVMEASLNDRISTIGDEEERYVP